MLSKCANPACSARFRYLHEGRIFNIEVPVPAAEHFPAFTIEHYWLCQQCSRTLKVVVDFGLAVLYPRHLQLPAGDSPADTGKGKEPLAA